MFLSLHQQTEAALQRPCRRPLSVAAARFCTQINVLPALLEQSPVQADSMPSMNPVTCVTVSHRQFFEFSQVKICISFWNRISIKSGLRSSCTNKTQSRGQRLACQPNGRFVLQVTFISKHTGASLLLPTWSQRDNMAMRWCDSDNGGGHCMPATGCPLHQACE